MRVNAAVFFVVAAFFAITDVVYWFTSYDPTGTTALAFAVMLAFLIAYYLQFTAQRLPPQPEDVQDADIADGAGEVGFFSPHSQWPFWMGLSAATTMLGVVFGWWLFFVGIGFFGAATMALLFEYQVGVSTGANPPDHFHS